MHMSATHEQYIPDLDVLPCCEIIEDFDSLRALADEWSKLWSTCKWATIFQSLPWVTAWWRAFGEGLRLCTLVVRQGREVIGILPLVRCGGIIRFLGTPGADYGDILCGENQAPQVVEAALRALLDLEGWRTCEFANLRNDSVLMRCSSQLPREIRRLICTQSCTCRSSLLLNGNRDAVIERMQRKSALRRHRNKMQRAGNVRFCHIEDREEIHHHLNSLFHQHITRRAMANERSQFLSTRWREFYHAMVDEMDPRHELRFSLLELDGRAIAYHFGFESKGSLTLYKPTFDVDAWDLSPGDVLLSEMLGYARRRQLNEVDFTVGREAYKGHFTNQVQDVYSTRLYRRSWRAALSRAGQVLYEKVSESPGVKSAKRYIADCVWWVDRRLQELRACELLEKIWNTGLIYVHPDEGQDAVSGLQLSVRLGSLRDITDLAILYPRSFNPGVLQEYMARLRRGDRCYLLSEGAQTCIGWTRGMFAASDLGARNAIKHRIDLLYDYYVPSENPSVAVCSEILEQFVSCMEAAGCTVYVRIPRLDLAMQRAMRQKGFIPRSETGHRQVPECATAD